MKDYSGALEDYSQAYERLDPQDKVRNNISLSELKQFLQYNYNFDKVNRIRALSFAAFCEIDLYRFQEAEETIEVARGLNFQIVDEKEKLLLIDSDNSKIKDDFLYAQRTNWILHYHWALCLYMKQEFFGAEKV